MGSHVFDEANRCLLCKRPLCMEGCPIHNPIPMAIKALREGDLNGAGKLFLENNPLSVVCSLVCNHEKQCEGHCIQGIKGNSIHISTIENYVSDTYFDKAVIECAPDNGHMVAIIGSGPAGITIAMQLAKKGYRVTIFESKDKIGGVLQYGIPDFRLPKTILERYRKKLIGLGVKIRPNISIGTALEISDLFRDGYEAIFIGTGVWKPRKLNVKGESLGNVHYAIDYLASPDAYDLGEDVVVIGAGNAAMDVARTVLRHGARHVHMFERNRTSNASAKELEYAKMDGAEIRYAVDVVEITEEGPMLRDIIYDEEGDIIGFGEEVWLEKANSTIISISQQPKSKLVNTTEGLKANERGLLITDEKGETTHPGIFASGDVVKGAKTVVEAVANAKLVAEAMDQYIQSLHPEQAWEN